MYCPHCGVQLSDRSLECTSCGWREATVSMHAAADDPALRMLLPVGRSVSAIIAGYLGLLSPVLVPAPFALLCGILALRAIKRNPDLGGKGRAIFGVVMGSLFSCLLLLFIVLLVAEYLAAG